MSDADPGDPPKPRRRGRPTLPPDQQRQRLIDAAERIFERSQYERTSVQDIVREAGMSSRTFYEFFESKEDLVAALASDRADDFLREMEQELADATDLLETVDRLILAFLERLPMVLIELEQLGGPAGIRVRAVRNDYRRRIRDLTMAQALQMFDRGLITELPSDPMVLELILAGIETIAVSYQQEGRREELIALHPVLTETVQRFLREYLS